MSKPTFVLVPGAWHPGEIYAGIETILSQHGYETIALTLPSVGASPAHETWNEDVQHIRQTLEKLIEKEDKNVILVSHSVNGLTTSEAAQGLSVEDRKKKALKGGIERLVYIMALAMPVGFQCWPKGNDSNTDWIKLDKANGIATVTNEDAQRVFYNDLRDEEAKKWLAKLKHQSVGVFNSTVTYAAWQHIPSTYVVATEDKSSVTREFVEYMINQDSPNAFDSRETCEGGDHCLMIGRPEWLAGALRRAAGEEDVA